MRSLTQWSPTSLAYMFLWWKFFLNKSIVLQDQSLLISNAHGAPCLEKQDESVAGVCKDVCAVPTRTLTILKGRVTSWPPPHETHSSSPSCLRFFHSKLHFKPNLFLLYCMGENCFTSRTPDTKASSFHSIPLQLPHDGWYSLSRCRMFLRRTRIFLTYIPALISGGGAWECFFSITVFAEINAPGA